MISLRWFVLASVIGFTGRAAAAPSCTDEIAGLEKWLGVLKADVANGAVIAAQPGELVAIPLQRGTAPELTALTLIVDKAGLHDANGPARPAGDAAALIRDNRSLAFARENPEAAARGIVVHAARDAPAAWVRAAVVAAAASGEKVWLVFRATDAKTTAPPRSTLTDQLAGIGVADAQRLAGILMSEFGVCKGLMDMVSELGESESKRLGIIIESTPRALATCQCKPPVDRVASILWTLAIRDLGVLVAVPAAKARALPWGAAKAKWADVAPAVVKTLKR